MNIHDIVSQLDEQEEMLYIDSTASSYFRTIYYSETFSSIVNKLDTDERLTAEDWKYLIEKLYMVTYKATLEEDTLDIMDKINYAINKIAIKIFKKGKIHNECVMMLAFLESIRLEKDINIDLCNGIDRVEESKSKTDLDILLRQHREAVIFRDNQDAFLDSYKYGTNGVMTDDDLLYIDCMDRSYIREKELVKEYK